MAVSKILKKLPQSETLWQTIEAGKTTYYVTSDQARTVYKLYVKCTEGIQLLRQERSPALFSEDIRNALA